jgi:pimeloyl-ACP methyl ester carboxylesterase
MAVDTTTLTGTDLYHEVRGSGPTVLFVAGATGDAGHFSRVAARLADEFTTIAYDRRGNSRSPVAGDAAAAATMAAQSDDAAAIIRRTPGGRAIVVGTSGGAIITLDLLARHADVVQAAVVHEPPLLSVAPPHDGPEDPIAAVLALAASDPAAALEQFIRLNTSETTWAALDSSLRQRMLGNAQTLFAREIENFVSFRPDVDALRRVAVPVQLLVSRDGVPYAPAVQQWLHEQTGWPTGMLSGHHASYLDQPELIAEELRPVLRDLCAVRGAGASSS